MSDKKHDRRASLDTTFAISATPPAYQTSVTSSPMRSAREAVDSTRVWDLSPSQIRDTRTRDRLDPADVADLREAIEANGQTVPILVRRHPTEPEQYLLVYGARRLEAIRSSDKISKVRALIANLDDRSAITAQISENMARRDLSFIEKALFARRLIDDDFGTQNQVAEVLTVSKSAISMALRVIETVTIELVEAIGAAHGIGRPRWEALGKSIEDTGANVNTLINVANETHNEALIAPFKGDPSPKDGSVLAFEAVESAVKKIGKSPVKTKTVQNITPITLGGRKAGTLTRTSKGLKIDLEDRSFADWIEAEAQDVISELHARFKARAED